MVVLSPPKAGLSRAPPRQPARSTKGLTAGQGSSSLRELRSMHSTGGTLPLGTDRVHPELSAKSTAQEAVLEV